MAIHARLHIQWNHGCGQSSILAANARHACATPRAGRNHASPLGGHRSAPAVPKTAGTQCRLVASLRWTHHVRGRLPEKRDRPSRWVHLSTHGDTISRRTRRLLVRWSPFRSPWEQARLGFHHAGRGLGCRGLVPHGSRGLDAPHLLGADIYRSIGIAQRPAFGSQQSIGDGHRTAPGPEPLLCPLHGGLAGDARPVAGAVGITHRHGRRISGAGPRARMEPLQPVLRSGHDKLPGRLPGQPAAGRTSGSGPWS